MLVIGAAFFIKNPPEDYKPEGWEPEKAEKGDRSGRDFEFGQAIKTWQWAALWALLFLDVTAGIAVISEAAPMAEEIGGASATAAASLVSIIAIFNGVGRFAWASFSDVIGRRWVFLAMFAIQAVVFFLLPNATSFGLFAVLACVILFCYGGGFGTMPAFAADYFGSKHVGRIYGLMLTAWSAAGIAGPLLISKIRDSTGNYDTALYIIAGMLVVSCIIPLIVRPPKEESSEPSGRFTRKDGEAVGQDREPARGERSADAKLDPHRPVVLDRPVRVVGDLPRVAVGVDEDAGVAAPERRSARAADRRPAASASASAASTSSGERTL